MRKYALAIAAVALSAATGSFCAAKMEPYGISGFLTHPPLATSAYAQSAR